MQSGGGSKAHGSSKERMDAVDQQAQEDHDDFAAKLPRKADGSLNTKKIREESKRQ
jgi:hypothetical protein